jgi:L-methionine (R)-S-oxide reductase
MAEPFNDKSLPAAKDARYAEVALEISAVLEGEANPVARMASTAAMLAQSFETYFWTGFYLVDPDRPQELVVGPYQGSLGCLRIPFGQGVCGAAAAQRRTLIVPDVHAFPGHIACDGRSRSEIVVPIIGAGGRLLGVLDVDSTELAAFDETDAAWLERILNASFGGATTLP